MADTSQPRANHRNRILLLPIVEHPTRPSRNQLKQRGPVPQNIDASRAQVHHRSKVHPIRRECAIRERTAHRQVETDLDVWRNRNSDHFSHLVC